jgi:hypothetical protein
MKRQSAAKIRLIAAVRAEQQQELGEVIIRYAEYVK